MIKQLRLFEKNGIMENKNINQFYNEVIADMADNPSWLEDLKSSDDFESLFAKLSQLGTEKGYNFSDQELRDALDSGISLQQDRELSDEFLAAVAGGKNDSDSMEPEDRNNDGINDNFPA